MSKYHREVNGVEIDFYDIADAYREGCVRQAGDAAIDHALKKLLAPGDRHSKSRLVDIREARASLDRAIEQIIKAEA